MDLSIEKHQNRYRLHEHEIDIMEPREIHTLWFALDKEYVRSMYPLFDIVEEN